MKIKKASAVILSLALLMGMLAFSTFTASAEEDPTQNPTGYCIESYSISATSNYCEPECDDLQSVSMEYPVYFRAPEDLEIVSFQFKLLCEDSNLELVKYSSFTSQMAYNTNIVNDRILMGSVSTLNPIFVEKDEPILYLEFYTDTKDVYNVYLEIEDLQVHTESGDKIIIQDSKPVDDGEDPTEDPTGHCTDEAMYHLTGGSNYCPDTPEFTGWDFGTHTLDFVAPDDLEILNLDFTLYHETPDTALAEYSAFSVDMVFETGEDNVLLSGNFTSLSPVLVMKGESLLNTVIHIETSYDTELRDLVYLEINNLTIKTPDGERVIFEDGMRVDKNPIAFVGDVDKNGKVNIDDATLLQRHLAEFTDDSGNRIIDETDSEMIKRADANRDGKVSVLDITEIQRYVAEMIKKF